MKQIEVAAAIVMDKGAILCVQRGKNKLSYISEKFEFPGGKIEKGEILGLENDMSILKKDFDKLQRTIVQNISNCIQDSKKEIFYTSHKPFTNC